MTPHDQDRLLKELLTGDDIEKFRRGSLDQGIAVLRLRRRRRQITRAIAMVCLPLMLVAAILFRQHSQPPSGNLKTASKVQQPAARIEWAGDSKTKLINDEELFALFPNRPMALIGKPGQQHLVFLDTQPSDFIQ